ncbi:hypothetical protein E5Q_06403 [Mixia osmundae IAM 14324]|uniref:Exostosin GT47 domain-containing protein n=1 Tax=Mixia osmundae (strain CBS 9802 / IAM 14324 / JCM 22182 / KY 12970) TaxID=764103 RepID=G7EA41_MIXOS|nr:hypothetical protein E5Q_06403 [Mixia osmundae IAM 14324]
MKRRKRSSVFTPAKVSLVCAVTCTLVYLRISRSSHAQSSTAHSLSLPLSPPSFPPLPALQDPCKKWPQDPQTCNNCSLKIYVYDLPEHLRLGRAQEDKCRWSAYSSELHLTHMLASTPAARYVTHDPSEANFFLVPLFPACYLFHCWDTAGWNRDLRCNVDEKLIQPAMAYIQSQPSWQRHSGRDHVMFHPMDFGDTYYSTDSRVMMRQMSYFVTNGDARTNGTIYRPRKDVVIPSATYLLHSYRYHPRDYLDEHGHPLSQMPKRPKDGTAVSDHVNIYEPTRARKWFASKRDPTGRTILAYFRGLGADVQPDDEYSLGVRSLFYGRKGSHDGFASLPGFDVSVESENAEYAVELAHARYGLTPPGHTLDSTRIWEYLAFGVVPVIIGADGLVLPFAQHLPWSEMTRASLWRNTNANGS